MKTCAIVQSSYIPWKGYFDLINLVDEFVLFDCVQYTRRDWRSRNRIKTAKESVWLTVPVQSKGNYEAPIDTILTDGNQWAEKHWQTISHNYAKAPYFKEYAPIFQRCYEEAASKSRLSEVNALFLRQICNLLEIKTRITDSREYLISSGKTERLMDICSQVGASVYYSGPSAKGYMDEELARSHGVEVRWMTYDDYPEYPQIHPPFEHAVSIIDVFFNVGDKASTYLQTFDSKVYADEI